MSSKNGKTLYCTTESAEKFESSASFFLNERVEAEKINLKIRV
jgi:hypothetical protein